ncbi:MAG: glycosyltransferase family 2 protein, partial [Flavobacterium sp.]
MIVVYHKNNNVVQVMKDQERLSFLSQNIAAVIMEIAQSYPQYWIMWCAIELEPFFNKEGLNSIFHHHKIMASFGINDQSYLPEAIGYVEESPFIKINKKVTYPTWQMSSDVGGVFAAVLLQFDENLSTSSDFNYFLHSLAKVAMPKGLIVYSEPKLVLKNDVKLTCKRTNNYKLFQFVKQHYRTRWVFLLILNLVLYQKQFPFFPLVRSLFFKNRNRWDISLDSIQVKSVNDVVKLRTIDVIIPTIGREIYLYNVLKDLSKQTHLPI